MIASSLSSEQALHRGYFVIEASRNGGLRYLSARGEDSILVDPLLLPLYPQF